jgi:hypothetical protein
VGGRHGVLLGCCRPDCRQRHPNGEISRGTFSGRITTAADGITMEGTWTMSGGTGSFSSIIGNGTYRGVITSATTVEVNWEGAYQLG